MLTSKLILPFPHHLGRAHPSSSRLVSQAPDGPRTDTNNQQERYVTYIGFPCLLSDESWAGLGRARARAGELDHRARDGSTHPSVPFEKRGVHELGGRSDILVGLDGPAQGH